MYIVLSRSNSLSCTYFTTKRESNIMPTQHEFKTLCRCYFVPAVLAIVIAASAAAVLATAATAATDYNCITDTECEALYGRMD